MSVDPRRAGVVRDDVREHVGCVARQRDQPVVGLGVDRDGCRAQLDDEPVQQTVALRIGVGGRCEEPGGAVEQAGARVLGAARFRAADRVSTDEPARAARGRDHAPLGRTDVRHGRVVARGLEHRDDLAGQVCDRGGDDADVRVGDGLLERGGRGHGAPRDGAARASGSGS